MTTRIIFVLVALMSFGQVSAAPQPLSARAQLTADYKRMDGSMSNYKADQFIALLKEITAPGKMRDSMLQGAEETAKAGGDPDSVRVNQIKTTIVSLTVHGNSATAIVKQHGDVVRRDSQGQYGPAGKVHHMVGTAVFRDTWVRLGKTWKLADEASVSETGTIDGKPMHIPVDNQ